MTNQYPSDMQDLADAIFTTPGDSSPELRHVVEAHSAQFGGRIAHEQPAEVPLDLTRYIDKVAQHAYKVTDADIADLQQAGYSDSSTLSTASPTRSTSPSPPPKTLPAPLASPKRTVMLHHQ